MQPKPKSPTNSYLKRKIPLINIRHSSSKPQQFTFRESNTPPDPQITKPILQTNISQPKNQGKSKLSQSIKNHSSLPYQFDDEFDQSNKNRSEVYTKNTKIQNQQDYPKFYNYKSKAELKFKNNSENIDKQLYENKIKYLQDHIEALQIQKEKRDQYLVKIINKNSKNNPIMKSSNESIAPSGKSRITGGFDIHQYLASCEKQRQQAKLIQEKAMKLKKKEKMERQLLKQMKSKLISRQNTERSHIGMGIGVGMDISVVSVIQKQSPENRNQQKIYDEKLSRSNDDQIRKFQQYDLNNNEEEEEMKIIDNQKQLEYPNILNEAQSMELDRRLDGISLEKQLRNQISFLKKQIQESNRKLQEEKSLRQKYQKQIEETDSKNVQMLEQYSQQVAYLEQQLLSKDKNIKKLEHLLDENMKLIQSKDIQIDNLCKDMKMKASLVESYGFGLGSSNEEKLAEQLKNTKKQLQIVKNTLIRLKDTKQEYFKQFMIDSVVTGDKKQANSSESPQFFKQSDQQNLEKVNKLFGEESMTFKDEDSDLIASQVMQYENQQLKQSVQLLSTKLKAAQTQLQKIQSQKNELMLIHSSFENKIMVLEEQKTKIQELRQKFSTENNELKNNLMQSKRLNESLQLEKKKTQQQAEMNIKALMQMMQDQKNREIATKIQEIALKLQENMKESQYEKKKLQGQVKMFQNQSNTYSALNKQLQSQVKSHLELSYHLETTINKQKFQIEILEEDIQKIKDENDKHVEKVELLEAERTELTQTNKKLTQQIALLNSLISHTNQQAIKYKLLQKEKEMEKNFNPQKIQEILEKQEQKANQIEEQANNKQIILKLQEKLKEKDTIIAELEQNIIKCKQFESKATENQQQGHSKIVQLQIQIDVLKTNIQGLQAIIISKNQQIKQIQQKISENSDNALQKQQQYKSIIAKLQQQISEIKDKIKQVQTLSSIKQEENNEKLVENLTLIQELTEKLEGKQKQIVEFQKQIQKYKQENMSMDMQLELAQKKIKQIMEKNRQLSEEIIQLWEKKPDLSIPESATAISRIYESNAKKYSSELYDICKTFSLKLVQKSLIKEVKQYLEYVKVFVDELSAYTQDRNKRLQGYLHKFDDVVEKEPHDIEILPPEISSSPIVPMKDHQIQPKSRFAAKHMQSLQINLGDNQEFNKMNEQSQKKSILLSEDFGQAFSHQDDHEDELGSRYKTKDKVNDLSSSHEGKEKINDSVSQGFTKSTHSLMQQLQAQQQSKKQMRNLKMKAKQKRRKV